MLQKKKKKEVQKCTVVGAYFRGWVGTALRRGLGKPDLFVPTQEWAML